MGVHGDSYNNISNMYKLRLTLLLGMLCMVLTVVAEECMMVGEELNDCEVVFEAAWEICEGSDDPKTCLEVAMTDAKAPYECVDCCCQLMDWFGHPSESCLTSLLANLMTPPSTQLVFFLFFSILLSFFLS